MLVRHRFAAAHAGVRGDHHRGLGVVDSRREARRREAAEHDGVDRADARAGEHRERGFRDHRHVDQHAIALAHAEALEDRRAAVHLVMQLPIGVAHLLPGFRREVMQRRLVGALREMAVDRVVAEVGAAADEPLGERRPTVIEGLRERCLPLDQCRLLAPEIVPLDKRTPVEFPIAPHLFSSIGRLQRPSNVGAAPLRLCSASPASANKGGWPRKIARSGKPREPRRCRLCAGSSPGIAVVVHCRPLAGPLLSGLLPDRTKGRALRWPRGSGTAGRNHPPAGAGAAPPTIRGVNRARSARRSARAPSP